jgi:hypothetical protein
METELTGFTELKSAAATFYVKELKWGLVEGAERRCRSPDSDGQSPPRRHENINFGKKLVIRWANKNGRGSENKKRGK